MNETQEGGGVDHEAGARRAKQTAALWARVRKGALVAGVATVFNILFVLYHLYGLGPKAGGGELRTIRPVWLLLGLSVVFIVVLIYEFKLAIGAVMADRSRGLNWGIALILVFFALFTTNVTSLFMDWMCAWAGVRIGS